MKNWITVKHQGLKVEVNAKGEVRIPRIVLRGTAVTNLKVTPSVSANGYLYFYLSRRAFYLHRLIADLFVPNPDKKVHILHKDGDIKNNAAPNLKWSLKPRARTAVTVTGQDHKASILDDDAVREIRALIAAGELTQGEIGARFGVKNTLVSHIKAGRRWAHVK